MSTPTIAVIPNSARKHHRRSPSSLQAREACAGYEPEPGESEASNAGQEFHDCCETRQFDKLDDARAEGARNCVGYGDEVLAAYRAEAVAAGQDPNLVLDTQEEFLPIDDKGDDAENPGTTAGYADRIIISWDRKKAHVIDYKSGLNPVEPAENNVQGVCYGLGTEYRFPTIDEIEVTFLMPFQRIFDQDTQQWQQGVVDHAVFKRDEFGKWRLRIETIVARSKFVGKAFEEFRKKGNTEPFSPVALNMLNPTEGTCLFCNNKGDCPKLGQLVLLAGSKYDPLIVPDVINPSLIHDQETAGKAIKFFDVIKAVSEAFRKRCTEKALTEEGFMPEGYQIIMVERRSIADKVRFAEVIKPLLTEEEFMACISFTFGPVEKIISAKAPRGKKAEAVKELGEALQANGAVTVGDPIATLRQIKEKTPELTK